MEKIQAFFISNSVFEQLKAGAENWFQWEIDVEHQKLQRITIIKDIKQTINQAKALYDCGCELYIIMDEPDPEIGSILLQDMPEFSFIFREDYPVEVLQILFTPDAWLHQQWLSVCEKPQLPLKLNNIFWKPYGNAFAAWLKQLSQQEQQELTLKRSLGADELILVDKNSEKWALQSFPNAWVKENSYGGVFLKQPKLIENIWEKNPFKAVIEKCIKKQYAWNCEILKSISELYISDQPPLAAFRGEQVNNSDTTNHNLKSSNWFEQEIKNTNQYWYPIKVRVLSNKKKLVIWIKSFHLEKQKIPQITLLNQDLKIHKIQLDPDWIRLIINSEQDFDIQTLSFTITEISTHQLAISITK